MTHARPARARLAAPDGWRGAARAPSRPFPLFAGNYPVKLLQEILIWGIFAMSLDLLMGYAGMVSFGHSAFFGIGGYVAALAPRQVARARLGPAAAGRSPPPSPRS